MLHLTWLLAGCVPRPTTRPPTTAELDVVIDAATLGFGCTAQVTIDPGALVYACSGGEGKPFTSTNLMEIPRADGVAEVLVKTYAAIRGTTNATLSPVPVELGDSSDCGVWVGPQPGAHCVVVDGSRLIGFYVIGVAVEPIALEGWMRPRVDALRSFVFPAP
jgi:hypothetical protein